MKNRSDIGFALKRDEGKVFRLFVYKTLDPYDPDEITERLLY